MRFLRFIGFAVVRAWHGFLRNAMVSLAATATVILMLILLSGLGILIG
jgi:cell division protein FtsX